MPLRHAGSLLVALALLAGLQGGATAQGTPGALSFSDISNESGLADPTTGAHGVFFADLTGDGLPDLYVTYNDIELGPRTNRFYRNIGGRFVEESAQRGITAAGYGTHGAAWVDLDNDGNYDLVLGITHDNTGAPAPNRILENRGGIFVDRTPADMLARKEPTRGVVAPDIDRDGRADLFFVSNWRGSADRPGSQNEAYRNDGAAAFPAIPDPALVGAPSGQGAVDTDFDGDGDIDIITGNPTGPLVLLRNDGDHFTLVPPESVGIMHRAPDGVTAADLDNDGDIDLILVDNQQHLAHLYLNNGNGTFAYAGSGGGFGSYTAGVADLDNDGNLDVVLPGLNQVFLGDGKGGFRPGPAFPGPSIKQDIRSIAFADIDGDGDLDFVISAKESRLFLVRNNLVGGHWLKVMLTSPAGQLGAFGAKVKIFEPGGGQIAMREVQSNHGYLAQDDPVVHFGLGDREAVDVLVNFLDGTVVRVNGVQANHRLLVRGKDIAILPGPPAAPQDLTALIDGMTVQLQWTAPPVLELPTRYRIEAGSAPGLTDLADVDTGSDATSFVAQARPGTYFVRVRAENAAGIGAASNERSVHVPGGCATPTAPTGFSGQSAGHTVTFQWTPASPGPFILEAGSSSGLANLAVVQVTSSPAVFTGVPSGRYYVHVRAASACGASEPSAEVIVVVPS